MSDALPPPFWRRAWRPALFAAALLSLPALWRVSENAWPGANAQAELEIARRDLREGRFSEARARAERVLSRVSGGSDVPDGMRGTAAEACLLAAEAALAEGVEATWPSAESAIRAARRAARATDLGANAAAANRIRTRAGRSLRELRRIPEAITVLERTGGNEAARELARALAAGNAADRKRSMEPLEALRDETASQDIVQTRIARSRVLQALGRPVEGAAEASEAAKVAKESGFTALEAEARVEWVEATIAAGRPADSAPVARAILRATLPREIRERAGIALAEADAIVAESDLSADLAELRRIPASSQALFTARARIGHRRRLAGRLGDSAAAYAAAFEQLGARAVPEALFPFAVALADLQAAAKYGIDSESLAPLARAAEGLAQSAPESEASLELAAGIAARRAAFADERARAAIDAGVPSGDAALEARALHGRAAEMFLAAADGPAVLKSRSLVNRVLGARELFAGGFHETAAPVFARLSLEVAPDDPRSPDVRWMRARGLQELGRHEESARELAAFLAAHRDSPRWAHDAFVELSRSLERAGRFEEAADTLSEFLFLYENVTPAAPRWRDALFALGDLEARLALDARAHGRESDAARHAAEAARNLDEAIRRFPTAYAARRDAAYRLGALAMSRRDWTDGARRFREALATPGLDADLDFARRASLLLGECLLQRGDVADALTAFGQAWTSRPGVETPLALERMSACHARLGDAKQAARFAERAKEALEQFRKGGGGGAEERLLERLLAAK